MIIKKDIYFPYADADRKLHIYLPDDYESSKESYPVMYFLDGHNLFSDEDATYGKSWGLKDFMDQWNKKMIIVGIECSHEGNQRLDEYSPYTYTTQWLGPIEGYGEETIQWIVDDIKPMIDEEYRTYYFREATCFAGSSMGGLMALYAGIKFNQYFSKLGCLSSAIFGCHDQLLYDISQLDLAADTRFYISWGAKEARRLGNEGDMETYTAKRNLEVAKALDSKQVFTKVVCQKDGGHCEADWEKLVPEFMDYLWF